MSDKGTRTQFANTPKGDYVSKPLHRNGFLKFTALCGPLSMLFYFIMFPSAGFLPPISPSTSAEKVVQHYQDHEAGIKGGIALMTLVGFFFPLYTAAIGGQISRIPGIPNTVIYAQLLGGALGGLFLVLPAYLFATTVYRLDRSADLTMLLNDLSWIFCALPFPSLIAQDLAFSYAVLIDRRPRPLFPHWLAYATTALTLTFWPAIGAYCVKSGPVAWNGGLAFWTAAAGGGGQICMISFYLFKAVLRTDMPQDGDMTGVSAGN